jgi:anti-sigma regulatory factor (Ser/Thr protein kinase)
LDIIINRLGDYSHLFDLCHIEYIDDEQLDIHLNLSFINPHDVLLLAQLSIFIKKKHLHIKRINIHGSVITIDYLKDIGLISFLRANYQQPRTISFINKRTAMPIRRVEQSSLEEYVYETLKYIGNICRGKELTMLSVGIKESINNVYDHAESEIGAYVFCQYYPKLNVIRVCVSDYGQGIPTVVRRKYPDFSDGECLRWALTEHNTTKSLPSNAGMGLSIIRNFSKTTSGELTIWTGNCCYLCRSGGQERIIKNISGFKGTLIELDIHVDSLNDEEDISDTF